uniref:Uncharacterized protein n=1 Tax=Trypanosoma vivax (strain Y486) TaxID=1055687 RepID=G0TSJ5_TRYVY|nr:hypothetical protein, unlikely [Trypanosoma vivax Y486]
MWLWETRDEVQPKTTTTTAMERKQNRAQTDKIRQTDTHTNKHSYMNRYKYRCALIEQSSILAPGTNPPFLHSSVILFTPAVILNEATHTCAPLYLYPHSIFVYPICWCAHFATTHEATGRYKKCFYVLVRV